MASPVRKYPSALSWRDGYFAFSAATVAGHDDMRHIAAERGHVRRRPSCRGQAILEGAGERRLGRPAVVDADDDGLELERQGARLALVREEVARHPAAAMEVDDR